jgi:hypothetical protein
MLCKGTSIELCGAAFVSSAQHLVTKPSSSGPFSEKFCLLRLIYCFTFRLVQHCLFSFLNYRLLFHANFICFSQTVEKRCLRHKVLFKSALFAFKVCLNYFCHFCYILELRQKHNSDRNCTYTNFSKYLIE